MTDQLRQANRIADLRERRAKRIRREAKAIEVQNRAEAQRAHDRYEQEKEQRGEAEFMLLSDPADPQALLWRQVADQNCADARAERSDAYERLKQSCEELAVYRKEHERAIERASIMSDQLLVEQAKRAQRREVVADEAAEECRH